MQTGEEGETQAAAREPAWKAVLQSFAARIERWRKLVDRHVTAALLMVAISILGAIAAFDVALAEQTSVGLERRLSIGQLEDAGFRQGLYTETAYGLALKGQARTLEKEIDEMRRSKTGFLAGEKAASVWLEWRIAELQAQRNALRRFEADLAGFDDSEKLAGVQLAERSARELRTKGFATTVQDGNVKFPVLERAIEKSHRAAPALSFCVLLFVIALVCLTIAELDFGSRALWLSLAGAGIVLSFAGTIQMALIDPVLWIIALIAVALCAALPLAIRWGLFSRRGGAKPTLHPENPEVARPAIAYLAGHSGQAHDAWSRGIVALIAVAVFFSAVFAWEYTGALKEEGVAALSAQETRTEFVTRKGTATMSLVGGVFDAVMRVQEARTRCAGATQFITLVQDRLISSDLQSAERDRGDICRELETILSEARREDLFSSMDDNGLIDSSRWPARALRQKYSNRPGGPDELLALADAKASESARWSDHAARYLAVLTVLSIVLFLFAQAHSMGRTSAGRLLAGAAIGLLLVSVAVGALTNLRDEGVAKAKTESSCVGNRKLANAGDVAELGAEKYELGVAALDRGSISEPGSAERSEADDEALPNLKCATLLLPDFIPAYQRYHSALISIGSVERDEDWNSLSDRTAVKKIYENLLAELRATSHAGLVTSSRRLADFAFNATKYALADGNRQALQEARTAVDALVRPDKRRQRPELFTEEEEIDPNWFTVGLVALASGEEDLIRYAPQLYDRALAPERLVSSAEAASALVDLELLRSYCSNLHNSPTCSRVDTTIDTIKGRVASIAASTELPVNSPATVAGFGISVTPYSVEWRANVEEFDSQRDRLSVVWYRDDSSKDRGGGDGAWRSRRALQPLLESYRPNRSPLPAERGGVVVSNTSVPRAAGYCLGTGRYVAELFINGALAGSASVDLETEDLSVIRSRELDLIGCIPSTWKRYGGKSQAWRADAPARTFEEILDGRHIYGATIAAFYAPSDMPEAARKNYFLRRAIRSVLNDFGQLSQETENDIFKGAVDLDGPTAECGADGALGGVLYRFLSSDSNTNLVKVVILNGNRANRACSIIKSFTNYFEG